VAGGETWPAKRLRLTAGLSAPSANRPRPEELPLRGRRQRRRPGRGDVYHRANGEDERPQPRGLPPRHAGQDRRGSPDQPRQRTYAVVCTKYRPCAMRFRTAITSGKEVLFVGYEPGTPIPLPPGWLQDAGKSRCRPSMHILVGSWRYSPSAAPLSYSFLLRDRRP
jgi:hypothetical protein